MSPLVAMITMATKQCNEIALSKPTQHAACHTHPCQLVNLTTDTGVLTVHFLSKDVTPPE